MTDTAIDLHAELHATIKDSAVHLITACNPRIPDEVSGAFTEGYLYRISYEELLDVYAIDISDAFFCIYPMHGPIS